MAFDPYVKADALSAQDLDHLAYFELQHALILSHAPRRFERARDLTASWDHLLEHHLPRFERAGIRAHAALSIPQLPTRTSPRLLATLAQYLEDPRVAALGEVMPGEDAPGRALCEALGRVKSALPILLREPAEMRVTRTYGALARLGDAGVEAGRVVVCSGQQEVVRAALWEGAWATLVMGPFGVAAREVTRVLEWLREEAGEQALRERLMLSAGLRRAGTDVMALARAHEAMLHGGWGEDVITALLHANAQRRFTGTSGTP